MSTDDFRPRVPGGNYAPSVAQCLARTLAIPRGTYNPALPVRVSAERRPPSGRSTSRDGEMLGSRGAEFHTIGEV